MPIKFLEYDYNFSIKTVDKNSPKPNTAKVSKYSFYS